MMSINFSNIVILKKNADYCCIITEISKSEAIKLFKNTNFSIPKKVEHYKKMSKAIFKL